MKARNRFDEVGEEIVASSDVAATPSWKVDYSKDFERKMLRTFFQDSDFATTTGRYLSHEHFSTPALRWLAQKLVNYVKEFGAGCSKDALQVELERDVKIGRLTKSNRDAAKALVDTVDTVVKDRTYVREELFRFIKNQTVDRAIRASIDHLDVQDFDSVDRELQKVLDLRASMDGGLGHFFVRDRQLRRERRKSFEYNGVPTGLFLDEKLKPKGIPPKSILTVVAPSGVGKSGVLMFMCKSSVVIGERKSLYITTELSEEVVCDRLDASFTGVSINMLEKDRKDVSLKVRDLGKKYGEFLVVKEFPPAMLSPNGLRSYIRQLEGVGFYPDAVYVDSADDMIPDNPGRERDSYEDYGMVWRGLRKLSYEVNAPVATASQTSRGALNKEHVDWDQIADSAKKVMVSDVVVILQQTREEHKQKVGRFYIAKNRFGSAKSEWKVRLDWGRIDIRTTG